MGGKEPTHCIEHLIILCCVQYFLLRKLHAELAAAMKQLRELQRMPGKKTMENDILKEAAEYGVSRKWIAHEPLLPKNKE
ncbi:hypothetical protein EBK54_16485 [Salmonella enterica subsp. enterica]|nr:hypothetical protein [Salmonella enterica]EBZ5847417.1 hypothetical protein [Salmonella enterica subsp. enterica serovar Abony]ECB3394981.1 hypothetical protein [Salmonella enterica subsp. enterica serovar Kottbus]EAR3126651.1 hypothetical protein [Salmonella enterica]EAR3225941.1 hypothetical protein [Salmonella enterica]